MGSLAIGGTPEKRVTEAPTAKGLYRLEPMGEEDWEAVRGIYLDGIATGQATFETTAPDWPEWDRDHLPTCRLVARLGGQVIGWGALSPVSRRAVYAGVAEVSVYVAPASQGQGLGKELLAGLINASEDAEIWTLQSSIFPENLASLAIHNACGFRELGFRELVAKLGGVWRDTVLLERRSPIVGVKRS